MKHKPTDLIFKIEHQFRLYLQRCEVTVDQLPPDQYREMRRAFYGGCGQLFFLFSQDMVELSENDVMKVMDALQDEVLKFWEKEDEYQQVGMQEFPAQMRVFCRLCGWKGIVADMVKPEPDALDLRCSCPTCNNKDVKIGV